MQHQVTATLRHMAKTQKELARILEAKRHVVVHMALTIHGIPDDRIPFEGVEELTEQALGIKKNISAYLNSLADLEEAVAMNLEHIVRELREEEEDE